jgi:hypothetical protein
MTNSAGRDRTRHRLQAACESTFDEIITEEEAQEPELEGREDGCRAISPTAVEAVEAAVDTPCHVWSDYGNHSRRRLRRR